MGPVAHACSGVVRGFPEVWLDAEGEIRIRAGGTQLIPGKAGEAESCLSRCPVPLGASTGRRMSNAGDPPRNLGRLDPAVSGLLIQGCVMKITGGRFPESQLSTLLNHVLRGKIKCIL